MKQYYYTNERGEQQGPINEKELMENYKVGKYQVDTVVWCDGMSDWLALDKVMNDLGVECSKREPLPTLNQSSLLDAIEQADNEVRSTISEKVLHENDLNVLVGRTGWFRKVLLNNMRQWKSLPLPKKICISGCATLAFFWWSVVTVGGCASVALLLRGNGMTLIYEDSSARVSDRNYNSKKKQSDIFVNKSNMKPTRHKKSSEPTELASTPLEKSSEPAELASTPLEKSSEPAELASVPLEKSSEPAELASAHAELDSTPSEIDSINNTPEDIIAKYQKNNGKQFEFSVDGFDIILIKCNNAVGQIEIPDFVTIIGVESFLDCVALRAVTIPASVTSIEQGAFRRCKSLRSVLIPDSVTEIGEKAFAACSKISEVTIGNSVTEIGNDAFLCCSNLIEVTIPDSVEVIGVSAFSSCTKLRNVTIGNSVIEIGASAFGSCSNLVEVTIPDSVRVIGDYAFQLCSGLRKVRVSASINEAKIGMDPFIACSSQLQVIEQ